MIRRAPSTHGHSRTHLAPACAHSLVVWTHVVCCESMSSVATIHVLEWVAEVGDPRNLCATLDFDQRREQKARALTLPNARNGMGMCCQCPRATKKRGTKASEEYFWSNGITLSVPIFLLVVSRGRGPGVRGPAGVGGGSWGGRGCGGRGEGGWCLSGLGPGGLDRASRSVTRES
jgi:hypothetical protein